MKKINQPDCRHTHIPTMRQLLCQLASASNDVYPKLSTGLWTLVCERKATANNEIRAVDKLWTTWRIQIKKNMLFKLHIKSMCACQCFTQQGQHKLDLPARCWVLLINCAAAECCWSKISWNCPNTPKMPHLLNQPVFSNRCTKAPFFWKVSFLEPKKPTPVPPGRV